MTGFKVKTRPIGAMAKLKRLGYPIVVSETSGTIGVVTGASEVGFNPLDLLFSSLAACLVLSARIAASQLGLIDRFGEARAHVTGEKSHEQPFRMTRLIVQFTIEGELDESEKVQIVRLAEEICTVSNTLKASPEFLVAIA